MTTAGPSKPVQVTTDPLAVMGGPARPVVVLTSGALEAGVAEQVYVLTDSELAERGMSGGEPIRVRVADGRLTGAGPAMPVYVVTGSLGGDSPTPPTPAYPDTGTANPLCMDAGGSVVFTNTANVDDMFVGDFTIEGWFKPFNTGLAGLIHKYNNEATQKGWLLQVSGVFDNFSFTMFNDQGEYAEVFGNVFTYTEGAWHHIAVTFEQSTGLLTLFVNGVDQSGTQTVSADPFYSDVGIPITIGGDAGGAWEEFEGCYNWINITNTILYTSTFVPPPQGDQPDTTDSIFNVPNQENEGTEVIDVISGSGGSMGGGSTYWDGDSAPVEATASFMFPEFPVSGNDHKNIDETWGAEVL